ncbi:MAG: glycosyltransferase family 4 protein [Gammaproteobacteria bacterium]|nr:glycosyltransferase family 4 protein [Gammaproteobacteria bacterium]
MPSLVINPYSEINSVAVIGNYVPRQCGIATFTADLVQALSAESTERACWTIAMNDQPEGYAYPNKVRFEINQKQLSEYRLAAEFLNINKADVVCLQHEYGIFGGPAGSHILKLLAALRMPVVTTLHTVLTKPADEYRTATKRLAELSDRLVVMSSTATETLHKVYGIDPAKISYIPHGIPDMPFVDPNYYKDQFDVTGKKLLLTFGLLSENKGIEYAIQALPKVIKKFPDIVYIILGATHPHVLKADGESYRLGLQQLVRKLNLEQHVIFKNRFVTLEELCEYLAATDVYITPYVGEAQVTSGTLAYAMGTGNPVVSTPYRYAVEMLAEGRGRLVPFKDPDAMADALIDILENDNERNAMRKLAYDYCRPSIWKQVARSYLRVFNEVKAERIRQPRSYRQSPLLVKDTAFKQELPELKLDHLLAMTDDTGLLQHANYTIPDRNEGYCTDDNARALIVAAEARHLLAEKPYRYERLCDLYLSFLQHAFDTKNGRFRNFMSYDRRWLENTGSEDSHGRALWGLGSAVALLNDGRQLPLASTLFKLALPAVEAFTSPRALAFTLIGIHAYLETFSGDSGVRRVRAILAERLFKRFTDHAKDDWPWLEDSLNYANARLPHALILSGQWMQRDDITSMGLKALEWLVGIQIDNGHFVPIGNHGWYTRGGAKARFDQQPLEAHATIDACVAAFKLTSERQWLNHAMSAYNWFLGHNDLNLPLYDAKTGGCRDGLQSDCVNQNQGAESTLAWLLSLSTLHGVSADEVLTILPEQTVAVGV